MRIFVTGASGYIGSAVAKDMVVNGHQVIGLARSEESETKLRAAGIEPLRGDITDLASLRRGAERADAVAHLAFNHDFSKFAQNGADDEAAIAAMGEVLAGSGKALVVTSGTALVGAPGTIATEDMGRDEQTTPRRSEQAVFALTGKGVKAMVIRVPQVHGPHDHGFVQILINTARQKGYAAYIGDGANRWPLVHVSDIASIYRLAIEKGEAGHNYHAVGEEGVALRDIATRIAEGTGVPARSITPEEAEGYYGWFALFAGMDNRSSSAVTRKALGWQPKGPTLLEDMSNPDYFVRP